ncbi:MAG: hypothetical protein LC749_13870 [Actinobacteria bacterium]|nr:hypothetical protein [Actinomycetota bacterium]
MPLNADRNRCAWPGEQLTTVLATIGQSQPPHRHLTGPTIRAPVHPPDPWQGAAAGTGEPIPALDYDPDLSHALLVAVVMKLGGSVELDFADLSTDSIGDQAGGLYALVLDAIGTHRLRLSVIPRQRN